LFTVLFTERRRGAGRGEERRGGKRGEEEASLLVHTNAYIAYSQ
jgi:hypothetical protein